MCYLLFSFMRKVIFKGHVHQVQYNLNKLVAPYYIGHDAPVSFLTVVEKRNIMHISDGFKQRPVGPLRARHIYEDSILSPSGECQSNSRRT